jgi:hypothetical protein
MEEAEQRRRERLTEARKRAVQTLERRREELGTAAPGGLLGTRMLWEMNEEEMLWYITWYIYIYIYIIQYTNDIYQ